MFKSTRAFLNALNEKKVTKNKLQLYDISGNNPIELDQYDDKVEKIIRLTNDIRQNNLKVYIRNMAELIGKRAIFATPIILGGITISSFVNGKYIKTINVSDVYRDTIIEFDKNSLLSERETTYAETFFSKNYVDDSIVSLGGFYSFNSSSYATIYYGEGSDSFQVKFDINDDNTWEYCSHTTNLYQKSENAVLEPISELDEEYKKLIKDTAETFIKQADLSEEEVAAIREIVSNDENNIIVKIKRCVNLGDRKFDIHSFHTFRCIIAVIAEIVLISRIVENFDDLTTVYELVADEESVRKRRYCINILKAAKKYREQFLLAESNRLSSILELLKNNGGNEKVIADFEKRLSLNKKEYPKLTDDL